VLYGVGDASVVNLASALGRVAEKNVASVREIVGGYFHDRDRPEPISRKELGRRVKEGTVTVMDVRPQDEFQAGHLPSAVNIPLHELSKRLKELPKSRDVVAYCRGPYCVLAFEAVAMLRERGFRARRLEDGYPEWKAAGLRVDHG
jgi:rhodanese-related sulfurtransferase